MPRASAPQTERQLAKLLLIGDGKCGKTHFAGEAGDSNFNVLYCDGDVARQTIHQLSAKAKDNIYVLPVGDRTMPMLTHDYIDFMVKFVVEGKLIWDDTNARVAKRSDDLSESEVWTLRPGGLDHNWVWVIDSWTSLVQSAMLWAAREHGVDLSDTNAAQMRNVYSSAGMKLTQLLVVIQRIGCHVIVIAHPDEFVKQRRPEGKRVDQIQEKDMIVEWTKMIPKSSSKPHAMTMSKYFTDVAWMTSNPSGTERQLDFRLDPGRVGGGHWQEKKSIKDYSFANLVKLIGGTIPSAVAPIDSVIEISPIGTYEPVQAGGKVLGVKESASPKADSAPTPTAPAKKGLAALISGNK